MIRLRLVICSLIVIFTSCTTYNTFYNTTDTQLTLSNKTKRLSLKNLNLNQLPKAINSVETLYMLNLSGNPKLDLKNALLKIPKPKKLKVLLLDSLELKTLPNEIKRFTHLEQLSLIHNPDLDLARTFDKLKGLPIVFLNLKHNDLICLPKNISLIKTLKEINLSYNHLIDPESYESLGDLPLLYSLWLDHNTLKQLPKTIGALEQIRFLYLGHNSLKSLPQEMAMMKNLWVLHAEYNKFESLPKTFVTMPSLLMVHINNNKIQKFSRAYELRKHSLKGLILDNNPILDTERAWAKKHFKNFFMLSFEQK